MADKKEVKVFLLPEGRLINSSLFEKDAYTPERGQPGKPMYKIEVAFDPKDVAGAGTFEDDLITAACVEWGDAAEEKFLNGGIHSPLLNGDDMAAKRAEKGKQGDPYKGKLVLRANTQFNLHGQDAPGGIQVWDEKVKPITVANQQAIYPGCYVQIAVTLQCYSMEEKFVTCYLAAVQKTRDGDPLVATRDTSVLFKPKVTAAAGDAGATASIRRLRG